MLKVDSTKTKSKSARLANDSTLHVKAKIGFPYGLKSVILPQMNGVVSLLASTEVIKCTVELYSSIPQASSTSCTATLTMNSFKLPVITSKLRSMAFTRILVAGFLIQRMVDLWMKVRV